MGSLGKFLGKIRAFLVGGHSEEPFILAAFIYEQEKNKKGDSGALFTADFNFQGLTVLYINCYLGSWITLLEKRHLYFPICFKIFLIKSNFRALVILPLVYFRIYEQFWYWSLQNFLDLIQFKWLNDFQLQNEETLLVWQNVTSLEMKLKNAPNNVLSISCMNLWKLTFPYKIS